MSSKKIAFFMRSAHGGGAERVMIALANQFAQKGYDIDFVFVNAAGTFLKDVDTNIRIVDLKAPRAIFALLSFYLYLFKTRPKYVISALNYINILALVANLMLIFGKAKVIVTEHGTLSAVRGSLAGTGKIVPVLMKFLYGLAYKIVAVSDGVGDDLSNQLGLQRDKIITIYNPIDFEKINQLKKEKLLHPWALQETPIVLGAGRLVDVKNFPLLINAFLQVRAKTVGKLVIIGEGERRAELEQLIQTSAYADDICLFGFTQNPYQWMHRASVFVLSSNTEGLPTVLIEAIAAGTQVISTNCPHGPYEILQAGKYGTLVPVGDVQAMQQAIYNALNNPVKTQDLDHFIEKFAWHHIVQHYEQLCP